MESLNRNATDSTTHHGARQRDSELLEKMRISFRHRYPRSESRQNRILTSNRLFEVGGI
jgi:hypothetical protein